MSNTRDNTPEMDYYELRRQREEYKQRMRMEQNAKNRSAAAPAPEPMEEPRSAQPQPEFIEEQDVRPAERDAFEAAIEEGYENAEEADFDDADDLDGGENPNPFDSFIHFFHGVKSSISARRGREEDEMDDLDELPEDEAWDDAEAPQRPAPSRRPAEQAEPEYEADEAANAVDIQDDFSRRRPTRVETDFQDEADSFIDDGFEDDLDEDMPRREGGFKKFMNLFVERVDEDDAQDEEEFDDGFGDDFDAQADLEDPELDFEEDEGDAPRRRGLFGRIGRRERIDEADDSDEEIEPVRQDARYFPILRDEPSRKPEGGHTMEENRKPTTEAVQTASAAEGVGMTRRERRELAMRLAAEEAARKAKEEAAQKAQEAEERRAEEERIAAEKPIAIEPLFSDSEPAAKKVDMAAFENAPETDILVETTAEEAPAVDEPTRKFKPVSLRDVQEAAKSDLFDVDDGDEDDEDDEDEIIEKKSRFSLFGRKKSTSYDDDEDEDDYEDDDEADEYDDGEDEDEDDADEIVEKKSRRGLFGRKKPSDDDDEDDEDDEYDDEDSDSDEDEDEEYDEYDDDDEDDDEYDEDEDEPRRSFGHHLLGIFKVILGVILVLLVIVIALNFFSASTVNKLHAVMGDSAAFQLLFPSYNIRASMPAEEDAGDDLLEDMLTPEPTALPEPEATVSIPNLDDTAAQGDTSIVTAPVVEAAPVTEGSIG